MSQDSKNPHHSGEEKREEPASRKKSEHAPKETEQHKPTRPTEPFRVTPAGGPVPELDEGPRPGPVDEIQSVLFSATQEGASTEVGFEELPRPGLPPEELTDSADIDFDDLPEPVPQLDEGPRPGPVDEIQSALFSATRVGSSTEVDFDDLPHPSPPLAPQKVIKFTQQRVAASKDAEMAQPEDDFEPIPLPDFPEIEPEPKPDLIVSDFWLLLPLFLVFRGLTLLLLRPGGFLRDWSDFDTYLGIAAASDYGQFPFLHFWLEWPPLLPWLAVGAHRLALLLPPWPDDPRFWFVLILGGIFVLFEVGNFVLIYRLARRLFEAPAPVSRVLWLYAGLFPPIYAMLGFFDGVALFFVLLALEFLLSERRFPSAVMVGVGFMVKIIPILMLPVALRRLWYQHRADQREAGVELGLYSVVFGLTVLLLLGPFLIYGSEWVLASTRAMLGRSAWETIWAVVDGYYGFGQVAGNRLDPNESNFAIYESALPWVHWLATLLFAGSYGFIFSRRADYSRPRPVIAFTGLTVAIFLLYSKGYSPQFLVYLLPFIVLLFPDIRGLSYALILTGLNILEQPIYFVILPDETWLLTFIVIARFLVISLLAWEFAWLIWPLEERAPRLAPLRKQASLVLGGLAGVAAIILIPTLLRTYTTNRLVDTPLGTFVSFMKIQAENNDPGQTAIDTPALLLSEQATYQKLYPYLRNDFELTLVDLTRQFSQTLTLNQLLQGQDQVWILPTGAQQQRLQSVVAEQGRLLKTFDFGDLGLAFLYSLQGNRSPFVAPARYATGLELLEYKIETRPRAVELTLYWRALAEQPQSLTVFTQILNANGEQVAGHDSIPLNGTTPTTLWPVNMVLADPHHIELPANLSSGKYQLIVGLYNNFGERLRVIDPNGFGYPNRAVLLTDDLQLP